MDRKEAISKNIKKYYTGKVCKNNHNTYRYTESGVCSGCLKSRRVKINVVNVKEIINTFIEFKVRLQNIDLEIYKSSVYLAAAMRYPQIKPSHIYGGFLKSTATNGSMVYKFSSHLDDVTELKALAMTLFKTHHKVDVEAARVALYGSYLAALPVPEVPPEAYISKPGDPDYKAP